MQLSLRREWEEVLLLPFAIISVGPMLPLKQCHLSPKDVVGQCMILISALGVREDKAGRSRLTAALC